MRISRTFTGFLLVGCIISVAAPISLGQGQRGQGGPGGPGGGRGGFGGFGGASMASLIQIKEVRDELKMDEAQTKEYDDFAKELREKIFPNSGVGRGGPGGGGAAGGTGGGRGGAGGPGGGRGGSEEDRAKLAESMTKMQEEQEAKLADILDPVQMDRLVGLFIQRNEYQTLGSKTVSTRLDISVSQKAKIAEKEKERSEEMRALFGGGGGGGGGGPDREKMDKIRKDNDEKVAAVLTTAQKTKMEELKGAKFEFPARGGFGGGRGGNPQ